jgi:hypothetical protein
MALERRRPICLSCDALAVRRLLAASDNSSVDFWRCDGCGHVWIVGKDGRFIEHVTDPPALKRLSKT